MRPTTRFAAASPSTMFTAVGVLGAIGRRELSVDDAVVDVLPADKRPSTLRDDVTVHHVLSRTSGIADYFEEDEHLPGYRDDDASLWHGSPLHELRDYAALLSLFGDLAPVCSPGITYHHSNAGDVLLGVIFAEESGMTFADAVATRVFAPAAMTASGYPAIDEVHPNIAENYLAPHVAGGPWRTNIFAVPPVGGGDATRSTVGTMARRLPSESATRRRVGHRRRRSRRLRHLPLPALLNPIATRSAHLPGARPARRSGDLRPFSSTHDAPRSREYMVLNDVATLVQVKGPP